MVMTFSVTRHGKPLDTKLYTWDDKTKTFSSSEDDLILDFSNMNNCTFNTGHGCTFKANNRCTFTTGSWCTFKTNSRCIFTTGFNCTFDTRSECTFDTGTECTFDTGTECTFKTDNMCIFKTASGCTFDIGKDCVVVRRDVFEIVQLDGKQVIKLNKNRVPGFTIISGTAPQTLLTTNTPDKKTTKNKYNTNNAYDRAMKGI